MNPRYATLKRQQLDEVLNKLRDANLPLTPASGWIKAIREALSMPATYLAKRLGVVPSSVLRMETSEMDHSITLATLKRAADALGCELHYSLVPRHPLHEVVEHRAHALALHEVAQVAHTMAMEEQTTSKAARDALVAERQESLLRGSKRGLWR